jgi:hypothetical protein
MERVDGKAAGDHGFITCQRIGLADGARADAIPNAAGGEGGHGAAKPDPYLIFDLIDRPFRGLAFTFSTDDLGLTVIPDFFRMHTSNSSQ